MRLNISNCCFWLQFKILKFTYYRYLLRRNVHKAKTLAECKHIAKNASSTGASCTMAICILIENFKNSPRPQVHYISESVVCTFEVFHPSITESQESDDNAKRLEFCRSLFPWPAKREPWIMSRCPATIKAPEQIEPRRWAIFFFVFYYIFPVAGSGPIFDTNYY